MRRVHLFTSSWDALRRTVAQLPDDAFEAASGCRGWRTADLVQHLSLQAQELLIALATPAETPPTADSLSWWTPTTVFPTGDSDEDALLARLADAQGGPVRSREHFEHVAAAAGRAALLAHPDLPVAAAERILTVRDLLGALVLEVTLHHLDLHAHLPDFALSSPHVAARRCARRGPRHGRAQAEAPPPRPVGRRARAPSRHRPSRSDSC